MVHSNFHSVSRPSSFPWNRLAGIILAWLLVIGASAQGRRELEKKRDALDRQIKETSALIDQARDRQQNTQRQVQLLVAQIGQRQELIRTMNSEVDRVDQEIEETRDRMRLLQDDLDKLKEEYARMVQFAYMNRNAYDRLSYIFAAESFSQAFRRSRYLEQLARQRQQQARTIQETRSDLAAKADDLEAKRRMKTSLLDRQVAETRNLTVDKGDRQAVLDGLKQEEGRLRMSLHRQEQQRKELAAAIRKAIEAEVAKSNKAKSAASKTSTGGKMEFTLTPEAKELNADFEKNKGKLPWPVDKGTITSGFGKQPHPVLRGITIENNGLDIGCEPGASVRAIFRGEVSSVIVIPGAGKAVMLSHGAYRTVYSNLRDVLVSKGDKVDTKQAVGVVMTEDGTSTAHIEIWKIDKDGNLQKVDPAAWIFQ
jgi:septal ring factor EnvC (AmiA/AmiB activator)